MPVFISTSNRLKAEKLKPGTLVRLVPHMGHGRWLFRSNYGWTVIPDEVYGKPLLLIKEYNPKDIMSGRPRVLWGTKIYTCDPEILEEIVI